MSREELKSKVLDLARAVEAFDAWDGESERPPTVEIEFDAVWKLVVVWDDGFKTIKIHQNKEPG